MKRLLAHLGSGLLLAGWSAIGMFTVAAQPTIAAVQTAYPTPTGYVNDTAHIFSTEEKSDLETRLAGFEKETSNEIALLTVPTTGDETIEEYSIHVADRWKVGKKGRDNGIIFTIAVNDHRMRLEIGRGLEGVIPDLIATTILDTYARPKFRQNDYFGGVTDVLEQLTKAAKQEFAMPNADDTQTQSASMNANAIFFFLWIVIGLFSALTHYMARTKSWWLGGVVGAGFAAFFSWIFAIGLVWLITTTLVMGGLGLLIDYLLSRNYKKHGKSNFWGMYWGGGGSSGGWGGSGGGGFSGFGGGSFSGGGGSSGW